MEIKLSAGDKINIPTGCKAVIKDGVITFEKEQEEFKDGDILHSKLTASVVIFKNYGDNSMDSFRIHYSNRNGGDLSWVTSSFRPATEEEKQAFFDELKAKGLKWNDETKQMERIRKRVEKGKEYLIVNRLGDVVKLVDEHSIFDDMNYNLGNYFLPKEIEEAELAAKFIRAIYEKRLKVQQ
jgi:hypothetical protein|nr:MAG TPA: hypothetical protein [Caudoviricetes sp.]